MITARLLILGLACIFSCTALAADKPTKPASDSTSQKSAVPDKAELFKKFANSMTNVKLVGQFTILGKETGQLAKEEYTILSTTKVDDGDKWLLKTRIKYGTHDVTVPLLLDIVWSGDTPVITLTNFTIPGLGTFGSRVLIYDNSYAGTWSHGKAGGHLFGTIEKLKPDELAPTGTTPDSKGK